MKTLSQGIDIDESEIPYFDDMPIDCSMIKYSEQYNKLANMADSQEIDLVYRIQKFWKWFGYYISIIDCYYHILTVRINQKGINQTYIDFIEDKTTLK